MLSGDSHGSETSTTTAVVQPSGMILMSMAGIGDQAAKLYEFDAGSQTLQVSPVQLFNPVESVDGRYLVGAYVISDSTQKPNGIYTFDLRTRATTLFAQSVGTQHPRTPQLSPDDSMVVFNEPTAVGSSPSFFTPSSWDIYLAEEDGAPQLIAHGIYPHWSPDSSSVLYLGDDGLHLYDVASSQDSLVYPVTGGHASTSLVFSLSKDGQEIALADPGEGELLVGGITSWQPFTIAITHIVSAYASWPVFSPDGTKLAYDTFDPVQATTTSQATDPELDVFDIQTGKIEQLFDLVPYTQSSFFATDWVTNL